MSGILDNGPSRPTRVGYGAVAYSTPPSNLENSLKNNAQAGRKTKFNDNTIWRGLSRTVTGVQNVVGLLALISTHLYTHVILGSHHYNFLSSMTANRLSLPQTGPRDHTALWISLINEVLVQCCFSLVLASSILYVSGSTALESQDPLSQTLAVIAFLISLDCATNSLIITISLRVMRVNATALQLVMERLNEPQLEAIAQCFATPFSSLIWSMISFGLCMASYYMHGGPLIAPTCAFNAAHSSPPSSLTTRGITLPPIGCVSVVIIAVLAAIRNIVNIRSLSQLRFKGKTGEDLDTHHYSQSSHVNASGSSTARDEFLSSVRTLSDGLQGLSPDDAASAIGPTNETDQL